MGIEIMSNVTNVIAVKDVYGDFHFVSHREYNNKLRILLRLYNSDGTRKYCGDTEPSCIHRENIKELLSTSAHMNC
jgi:hypothetical protein